MLFQALRRLVPDDICVEGQEDFTQPIPSNKKSQEWEIVYHLKEVPQKQLEFHLKGEVAMKNASS